MQALYNTMMDTLGKINYQTPTPAAYDGPKLNAITYDEPAMYQKAEITGFTVFAQKMYAAEDLASLEAIGSEIKASDLLWKEKRQLETLGKQIAQKFIQ